MDADSKYSEAYVIGMKILGAIAGVIMFRWIVKIFAGKDGKVDVNEFLKMVGVFFFLFAGSWMIYKEGTRTDMTHEVFGMGYLAIIFGSLLTVLHLDHALEKITKVIEALVKLKTSAPPPVEHNTIIQANQQNEAPTGS